jgi:SAM-dependent methyltransferase
MEVKDAVVREQGKPPLFLDVGCGNGRNLLVFNDLVSKFQVLTFRKTT